MAQAGYICTEALRRFSDDLAFGELVAEPVGQRAADLDPQAPQILGDGDDAHGDPPEKAKVPTPRSGPSLEFGRSVRPGSRGLKRARRRAHYPLGGCRREPRLDLL